VTKTFVAETAQDLLGAVFVCNWGYDQTNIDFYMITKVTPKTVTLTQIGATRDEKGYLWPNTEVLTDKVLKNKKPKFYSHGVWINITTYSGAGLWDGKGQADTWTYGGGGH
jgi:hypothetical protein